jgi:hypothetical protein
MIDRNCWNAYFRLTQSEKWTWIASGGFYTEAHGAAMLLTPPSAEVRVCFGRTLPDEMQPRTRRISA